MALNIADLFEHAVDAVPDNTALIVGDRSLTFQELEADANRFAHHLRDSGFGHGSHVGLLSPNSIEHVVALLGALKIRAIPINLNYRYTAAELRYVLESGDVDAVFYRADLEDVVAAATADLPRVRHRIAAGGDPPLDRGAVSFRSALNSSAARDFEGRSPDDLYILFTGGTTGYPKGVMWRHEDIWRTLGGGIEFLTGRPLDEFDQSRQATTDPPRVSMPLCPLSHGAAVWSTLMHLFAGQTTVLMPKFDPVAAWEAIDRHRVQVLTITGDAMARPLIETYHDAGFVGDSLVAVASSAAIFSDAVKRVWLDTFPNLFLTDSVGATEVGSTGVGIVSEESISSDGPVVSIAPGVVFIDDDDNLVDPAGRVGETLRIGRGGHIPLGYYGDEEKSRATFREKDGTRYAVTGDFVRIEPGARITLLGRGSGCINSGGEKVFPEQVEIALKSHPDVYDALVVGIPDERWGKRVAAVIQPRPNTAPSVKAIQDHVRTLLAGFKVPRSVVLVDEIPRHVTGKPNYPLAQQILESRLNGTEVASV